MHRPATLDMAFKLDSFVSPRPVIESGKVTIPELYAWHSRENPSYPIFCFDDGESIQGITYADMDKGILRAARLVRSLVGGGGVDPYVFAILANAGSSFYATRLVLSSYPTQLSHFY